MLKPPKPGHFEKSLFKNGKHASVFFNTLLNLVKFISHEGRDLFQLKNVATEYPDWRWVLGASEPVSGTYLQSMNMTGLQMKKKSMKT